MLCKSCGRASKFLCRMLKLSASDMKQKLKQRLKLIKRCIRSAVWSCVPQQKATQTTYFCCMHAKSIAAHLSCALFQSHALQYQLSAQLLLLKTRLPICNKCNITNHGVLSLHSVVPFHTEWALTSCSLFTAAAVLSNGCNECWLDATMQAEIAEQAASIQRLEAAMAQNLEDLEATQAQLEATQSSLIDLEDHLTTLEEEDDDDLEPPSSPSSLLSDPNQNPGTTATPPENRPMNEVASDLDQKAGQPGTDLTSSSSATASGKEDEVQSAFVSTMDSLFPPAQDISDEDAAAAEQLLCEDPYELFERSKAALQARAEQRSAGQQQQPPAKPDLPSGHQESPSQNSSLAKVSGELSSHLQLYTPASILASIFTSACCQ